jgi:putative ATP-binding cassette transporter
LAQGDDHRDQRAQEWLQRLHLEQKVQVIDGKFSTLDLSFGQRKRLALLTAYLEDRPVYLFDEWAAGQDPEFRTIFYRTLLPDLKAQGKLVIVISHDDQYFDAADRIIKLDAGRIDYDRRCTAQPKPAAIPSVSNERKGR